MEKAIAMEFILMHIAADDAAAQEALKTWGEK